VSIDDDLALRLDIESARSAWPLVVCCHGGKVRHLARWTYGRFVTACRRSIVGGVADGDVNCGKCIAAIRQPETP